MAKIQLVEMGMRDGLQNEAVHLDLNTRFQLLKKLVSAGLKRIEIGAFVSPKWVPQMSQTRDLAIKALRAQKRGSIGKDVQLSALVPNLRGYEDSQKVGMTEVAIFGAASESFSRRNINCSIAESLQKFAEVAAEAKKDGVRLRAYLSTVFACPYEGVVSEAKVLKLIEQYLKLGVYEISLGDTIGVASPKQVRSLLQKTLKLTTTKKIALHFHDTRGTALANILASLDLGFHTFDASLGGLGGCPYAPGAAGNVATEDVTYMLTQMGFETGVHLPRLIQATRWMSQQVGRPLPAKLALAGLPRR